MLDTIITSHEKSLFRRDLYRLISKLFLYPPTEEDVSAITNTRLRHILSEVFDIQANGLLKKISRLSYCPELREEFFALLSVPTARYVTPFESVYCDKREIDGKEVSGLLGGKSMYDVANLYEKAGFTLAASELPDHIGCELGFLAMLVSKEADSIETNDEEEAKASRQTMTTFIKEHLLKWFPKLIEKLSSDTEAKFYPSLAELAFALLKKEIE